MNCPEDAKARRAAVQEEEGKTVSDWSGASLRITSREDRIREINREIRELRGEG